MKRHKYGYLVAGVAVLGLFLAGCHSTQSSSSATSQPKATHTAKKANPVDQVFKPLSQKVSEDAGTLTNGGEETYSQFYKKKQGTGIGVYRQRRGERLRLGRF